MRLRFTIKTKGLDRLNERMERASPRARHALAVQMAKDTELFVPARTKSLSNRTRVDEDVIIYPGPYARFLYYGKITVCALTSI